MAKRPKTIDEAAELVLAAMTRAQKEELRALRQTDLISAHFGLGMWVRNDLDLWNPANPLRAEPGCFGHADEVSARIIERMWEKLQPSLPQVDDAG